MGHIELTVPVAHIWYFRSTPNKIGYLLAFLQRNSSPSSIMKGMWLSMPVRPKVLLVIKSAIL